MDLQVAANYRLKYRTEESRQVNHNIKPYKGRSLSAVRLQEFLIRQTRSCADKGVVLDVGVMISKAEYVRSAYSCGRCLFCSKSTCMPTVMARQRCVFCDFYLITCQKKRTYRRSSHRVADTLLNYASCCNVINNYSNYCSQLLYTRALAFSDVDGKGRHVPYYDSDFTQHITINIKNKKSFNRHCSYVIHASFNPITLPTAGAQTSIQRLDSYHYPISPPHSKWVTCSMQSSSQKSITLVYGSHPSRFAPLRVKTIVHRYSKKNTNKHVPEC